MSRDRMVFIDLFKEQLKWSVWFLAIIFTLRIIHLGIILIFDEGGSTLGGFLNFSHQSAKIYMLIVGIVALFVFLTYAVQHGITRMEYIKGGALAAIALSLALAFISMVFAGSEYLLVWLTGLSIDVHTDSLLGVNANWLVLFFIYTISVLLYYLLGWLIASGFYHSPRRGFWYIALAIGLLFIDDFMWGTQVTLFALSFSWASVPWIVSIAVSILIILFTGWVIKQTLKNITIKM
ncbi:hypothetical protein [Halalkalibacillus halophilus]|uniref:hypothetical protein n=1 Tax=Halalkalibacillus halophilus TaxID=392827 RepID=UPI0003F666FC|nr:hypothetical protein [Halalkalibacillus halophilus]